MTASDVLCTIACHMKDGVHLDELIRQYGVDVVFVVQHLNQLRLINVLDDNGEPNPNICVRFRKGYMWSGGSYRKAVWR